MEYSVFNIIQFDLLIIIWQNEGLMHCISEKLQEAVDLYTKAGMNRKALLCAQKSGDKKAIGQSLILDSKIRLNDYEEFDMIEEDVRNEICENLDKHFSLCKIWITNWEQEKQLFSEGNWLEIENL